MFLWLECCSFCLVSVFARLCTVSSQTWVRCWHCLVFVPSSLFLVLSTMPTTVQKLNQWSLWTCHTSPKWATSCHLPLRWLHSSMYLYFFSQQLFNWRQAVRLWVNVDSCVNCWDLVSTWGHADGMKSQTPGWKLCRAKALEAHFRGSDDTWKINALRATLICGCAIISLIGKDSIDAFIALILDLASMSF